jgi:hypothetical protein
VPSGGGGASGWVKGKRSKQACSFLKKRTKKLLQIWPRSILEGRSRTIKSFLLLFFKKEGLAYTRA